MILSSYSSVFCHSDTRIRMQIQTYRMERKGRCVKAEADVCINVGHIDDCANGRSTESPSTSEPVKLW